MRVLSKLKIISTVKKTSMMKRNTGVCFVTTRLHREELFNVMWHLFMTELSIIVNSVTIKSYKRYIWIHTLMEFIRECVIHVIIAKTRPSVRGIYKHTHVVSANTRRSGRRIWRHTFGQCMMVSNFHVIFVTIQRPARQDQEQGAFAASQRNQGRVWRAE